MGVFDFIGEWTAAFNEWVKNQSWTEIGISGGLVICLILLIITLITWWFIINKVFNKRQY